jgi:hypothetical protein
VLVVTDKYVSVVAVIMAISTAINGVPALFAKKNKRGLPSTIEIRKKDDYPTPIDNTATGKNSGLKK